MKDPGSEREALLEAATGAWRERDAHGRIQPAPAWMDLDPAGRDELFARQWLARVLERALAPDGLSSTGRTVTHRSRSLSQLSGED